MSEDLKKKKSEFIGVGARRTTGSRYGNEKVREN